MRKYKICCAELNWAIKDGDLRRTPRGILLGTNNIWYCPFCGEDITWGVTK